MDASNEWWLKIAKTLPIGGKKRVQHHCGEGRAAVVNHQPKGFSLYCHRCGDSLFVPHGQRSFKELMELRKLEKQNAAAIRGSMKLPSDFTLDIPPVGMLWLLKASITPYMARKVGIGWSHKYQRVILPVYNDNNLVFYQARAVHEHQDIKYLNPSVDRASIAYWVIPPNADNSVIIITEDILSAIRVGQLIPAVSMLGTKLSEQQAEQVSNYDHVVTWLDPDEAGIVGAQNMRKMLSLAVKTSNIVSSVDPKNLPDRLILQHIEEIL